jgi:uracil-DNA glycosylase family 4
MNPTQFNYLNAMGIQTWQLKPASPSPLTPPPAATDDLNTLRMVVANCTACGLHKTRTQTVFGVGNCNADLMLIGEAPGFYEDQKGEPFVGRAGQLLNAMLQAIGMNRNTVYIANILKCRPPHNRDPLPEEVSLCTLYLEKQIALIKPKLLLALGRIAAQYLLKTQTPLGQMRGKSYTFGKQNTPLIVTYHPAYLLRNPRDKGKALQDLQSVLSSMQK